MSILKEFKEFALKGNVVDLAVGVIIGAAFGAIITSLVDDVITPLILTPALKAIGASDIGKLTWGAVKYGNFLAAVIKFIVIAFVLFLIIKAINSTKKKETPVETAPTLSTTEQLLMDIRDELKSKPSV